MSFIDDGSPRKVTSIPTGYVLDSSYVDKTNPNRKYYKRSSAINQSSLISPQSNSFKRPISTVRKTNNRPTIKASTSENIDRVYMEDTPLAPSTTPAKAFMGDNIFMNKGVSNVAIGQAKYPSRNSANTSDGGMLDTGNQNVQFQYYKPNTSILDGDTIDIPYDEWNNRGETSNFAKTDFINRYKPKMAMGGNTNNPPPLFKTNKIKYVDSLLNANNKLDWVKRLYEKNAPSIQIKGQPYRSTHFMADDGNGYVFPTVVRENGKLKYLENNAEDYARQTNTGIQLPKEEGSWFAANGYKIGTNVNNDINQGVPYNKPNYKLPKMDTGGTVSSLAGSIPSIANALMTAFSNHNYSNQPIVNASVARSMMSPYSNMAFGGTIDDLDPDELEQLKQQAAEQGISPEELLDQINQQQYNEQESTGEDISEGQKEEENSFATGGWVGKAAASIKRRGTKGKCTPITKPGCTGRAKALAKTFKKMAKNRKNYAMGGNVNEVPVLRPIKRLLDKSKPDMQQADAYLDIKIKKSREDALDNLISNGITDPKRMLWELNHDENGNEYDGDGNKYGDFDINEINQFLSKRMTKKMAMGGNTTSNVEVEGKEIVQRPGEAPFRVRGPKHENGGVDIHAPQGTKVYSDRLHVDGQSMQERKAARELRLSKLQKLLKENPFNKLTRNTFDRTNQQLEAEDAQDMALQDVAKHIYSSPTEKMAGGGHTQEYDENGNPIITPFTDYVDTGNDSNATNVGTAPDNIAKVLSRNNNGNYKSATTSNNNSNSSGFTTGDYVGMAGTLFSSIAPLINSRNAARATQPVINRYQGYGQRAIDANQTAQDYAATEQGDALSNIDTSYNSDVALNRNGASDINTMRALDIASSMGRDKARATTRNAYTNQMIGLLGQRGQLTNAQDQYQDYGQTAADTANQQNIDNLFTNKGADLSNLGTGIQTIGKDFNINQSNKDDSDLISLLGEHGIRIGTDKYGKKILINS